MTSKFLEKMIRNLGTNNHDEYPHSHIEHGAEEIKIVLRLTEIAECNHTRCHLERRVYTHRANHNHTEYSKGQYHEHECSIDTFFLHDCEYRIMSKKPRIISVFWEKN
jgi:hypothetical protein